MRPQAILENLGYSKLQAKIYLGLLKMGSGTVTDMSHNLHIPRSTIKDAVEQMHINGLINYYPKRGHKVWTPENPQKLMSHLREKENEFNLILPRLLDFYKKRGQAKFSVQVFSGSKELALILEDIIDFKRNVAAFASWQDLTKVLGAEIVWDFFEKLSSHFLSLQLIAPEGPWAQLLKSSQTARLKLKFLPGDFIPPFSACFVYGERLALMRLTENSPQGLIIHDQFLARQQQIFLDNWWNKTGK